MSSILKKLIKALGFIFLFLCFAWGTTKLQQNRLKQISFYRPYQASWLVPRTEYANVFAFGYNTFMADFLYIRIIQAFGGASSTFPKHAKKLHQYFSSLSELDPQFLEVYEFGSMALGEDAQQMDLAMELLHKGWVNNPDEYRLPYLAAYMSWWGRKDEKSAILWAERATKAPNCPRHVGRMIQYILRKDGRYKASVEKWIWDYVDALKDKDSYILDLVNRQLKIITDEWNISILHDALRKWIDDHEGHLPKSLAEMDRAGYLTSTSNSEQYVCDYFELWGMLQSIPEMLGTTIDPDSEEGEQLIQVIAQKTIRPLSGVPRFPYETPQAQGGYYIRKDLPNSDVSAAIFDGTMIINPQTGDSYARSTVIPGINQLIEKFRTEHGYLPFSLWHVFPDGIIPYGDPMGTPLVYDYENGTVVLPRLNQ